MPILMARCDVCGELIEGREIVHPHAYSFYCHPCYDEEQSLFNIEEAKEVLAELVNCKTVSEFSIMSAMATLLGKAKNETEP